VVTDPAVSVIVPVRDGADSVGRLLDALSAQVGPSFEVIVVDNGSTDDTATIARLHPLAPVVVTEHQRGSYAARNAGLGVARAPILAFTDADCTPRPSWLAAGVAALDSTGADLLGGAVQAVPSVHPTVWERYDRAVYLRQEDLVVHSGWAVTANLFVRRTVVDTVGGFDGSLPSSGDREFCLRAGRAGFRIAYAAEAVVGHQPRTTMREIWKVNRRIGAGMGMLSRRGEFPPWWRSGEHWMPVDWVIVLISRDGPPLRRRHVLPVHTFAMTARLYGRLRRR
jgi:glycosyltransferase involved in cell wall biosynthesis